MAQRIILYDVARFINRAKAATPTGIDRVDIRYFEHFLEAPDTTLVGVVQKRGRLVRVPEAELQLIWRLLKNRWIEGYLIAPSESRAARLLKLRSTTRSFLSRFWGRRGGATGRLDPGLQSLRLAHPEAALIYVNCSHNGIRETGLFDAMRIELDARLLFYVHDTIPIDYPQYVRAGFDLRHVQRMEVIVRTADRVLTNSRYSRDRFRALCQTRGFAPPPVEILQIGVEPTFLARAAAATAPAAGERPYFVAVGTIEPRKNLSLLLRVWARLGAEGGLVPELRLIGRRGWVTETNRDFDALLARVADHVIELGSVGDGDLVSQIAGARALLFPSFVEGWGMPLVEAQVVGTPAIASDIDAFREASQTLADLIDPKDEDAWTAAVRTYAAEPSPTREAARTRLSNFEPPTWADHFRALEQILASCGPTDRETADNIE